MNDDEQNIDKTKDQQIKADKDIIKELERKGKLKKSVMKGGIVNEYENEKPRQG
jgi:ribosomal protein S6